MVVHPPQSILLLVLNPYPIWNRSKLDGVNWYTVKPWKTYDIGRYWILLGHRDHTVDVDSEFCFSLSLLWGVPMFVVFWTIILVVSQFIGGWHVWWSHFGVVGNHQTLDFMGWTSCWYQVWNELFRNPWDFYCWANHRCSVARLQSSALDCFFARRSWAKPSISWP